MPHTVIVRDIDSNVAYLPVQNISYWFVHRQTRNTVLVMQNGFSFHTLEDPEKLDAKYQQALEQHLTFVINARKDNGDNLTNQFKPA